MGLGFQGEKGEKVGEICYGKSMNWYPSVPIIAWSFRKWIGSRIFFFFFFSLGPINSPTTRESCWFLTCWYTTKGWELFSGWREEGEKCHFSSIFSWLWRSDVLWHLKSLSFHFFGPSPLVLNYSTDFILFGFQNILWVNWCVIYSLSILNGVLQTVWEFTLA